MPQSDVLLMEPTACELPAPGVNELCWARSGPLSPVTVKVWGVSVAYGRRKIWMSHQTQALFNMEVSRDRRATIHSLARLLPHAMYCGTLWNVCVCVSMCVCLRFSHFTFTKHTCNILTFTFNVENVVYNWMYTISLNDIIDCINFMKWSHFFRKHMRPFLIK